jgi:hypothetical protein
MRTLVNAARERIAARQSGNLGGAVLSAIMREIEDNVLMAMVGQLSTRAQAGLVLVFDGFMVPQDCCEGATDDALLRKLEQVADTATGWKVRLARKPMDEAIDLAGLSCMMEDVRWRDSTSPQLTRSCNSSWRTL